VLRRAPLTVLRRAQHEKKRKETTPAPLEGYALAGGGK
jgi:hypothetical protein